MIVLPWPDKRLSPNARVHWAVKAAVKGKARTDACRLATVTVPLSVKKALRASDAPIPLEVTFYPPDRRHRDDDNMVGSFKSLRDGIADALGVNDRRFRPHYFFADPEKPGRIEVSLGEKSPQSGSLPGDPCYTMTAEAGASTPGPQPDQNTYRGGA